MTATLTRSPADLVMPRFGTERNPARPTRGHEIAEVARLLGKPFMPWQQHVADVALEIDPDTGGLAYSSVGLTVPRQSGKSTFLLSKVTHRASATGFFGPRQVVVYTAQNRNKAREKWEEDYAETLEHASAFDVRVHKSNGHEAIRFPNRSRFGIDANTEKAGHGSTIDEAYIDEAFAQVDNRLLQAFRPAMITRANKQLWIVSTAGWLGESPLLESSVKKGRAAVEAGEDRGRCYFEWSAPDDADPFDRSVWWECMPALGHTITEEAIAAELEEFADNLDEFRRAYLNQWRPKGGGGRPPIDSALWDRGRDPSAKVDGRLAIAVDRMPDGDGDGVRWTSVAFAGECEGVTLGALADHRPGTAWVVARVQELVAEHDPVAVVIDPGGPAAPLIDDLRAVGVDVSEVTGRTLTQACGALLEDIAEGRFRHLGQAQLDGAVAAAKRRQVGDAWTWARRDTASDISPLVAVTLARSGLAKWRAEVDDDFPVAAVWA